MNSPPALRALPRASGECSSEFQLRQSPVELCFLVTKEFYAIFVCCTGPQDYRDLRQINSTIYFIQCDALIMYRKRIYFQLKSNGILGENN
jgi:hypothetical protein